MNVYHVVQGGSFESVNEILQCEHSNGSSSAKMSGYKFASRLESLGKMHEQIKQRDVCSNFFSFSLFSFVLSDSS